MSFMNDLSAFHFWTACTVSVVILEKLSKTSELIKFFRADMRLFCVHECKEKKFNFQDVSLFSIDQDINVHFIKILLPVYRAVCIKR